MDFGVGPLMAAMFTTGLLGGLSHCAGMCGPFVLAQVGAGGAAGVGNPTLVRVRGAMLMPYHLGRITTYAVLGGAAAAGGGALVRATDLSWLFSAILVLAALLFLRQGLAGVSQWLPDLWRPGIGGGSWLDGLARRLTRPLRPLFANPGGINGYLLGLALGFLPCGLVYAGLASAMGMGDGLSGALMMAAFGAGTIPALWVVGWAGGAVAGRWRRMAALATPLLMLVNAWLVGRMAWHLLG